MRQKAFFKKKKGSVPFGVLDFQLWIGMQKKLNFFSKLPENIMVDRTAKNWIFHPIKIR